MAHAPRSLRRGLGHRAVPVLKADEHGVMEATTLIADMQKRHGRQYGLGQLRTLQRRVHEWRALHGPVKEVMFEQRQTRRARDRRVPRARGQRPLLRTPGTRQDARRCRAR